MNKISQLSKILVVFLAGFVLLISTACSSTDSAQASRDKISSSTEVQKLTQQPNYDRYDANQPKQGGMNKYNDDPRLDNPKMQEKVDNLVKGARANLQQRNDTREEYVDKISKTGQVLGNIKEDVAQKAEDFKNDLAKGAQQRMDTAKSNLDSASMNVKRAAEDTSDAVGNKVNDTAKAARRTAEDTLDRVGDPS